MKKQSLLRNQLLLLGGATFVSLILGLVASIVLTQLDPMRFQFHPTVFVAQLIEELHTTKHMTNTEALKLIQQSNDGHAFPLETQIFSKEEAKDLIEPGDKLPTQLFDYVEYGSRSAWHFPRRLVKLSGDTDEYLSIIYRPRTTPMHRILNAQTGVMMFSVFLAGLFTVFYMFYFMRKKAMLAGNIISQLRAGDLSARFPVGKMDEIGLLMGEFNRMADEIQTLVETIRNSELGRMRRLQELAHDLRTPVASLKNLLEMLQSHRHDMKAQSQDEILNLSLKEVEYFQRLVEDLLFLAQVRDPKYAVVKTCVDIIDLLNDELEKMRAHYPNIKVVEASPRTAHVKGDGHLLRRLFRNSFENAFSFAHSQVEIRVENRNGKVAVFILDDGPGFNSSTLSSFGEKRGTRTVTDGPKGRLSVGLGSVIMKEVVNVHGGTISVRNGTKSGAILEIGLPDDAIEEGHPRANLQP